MTSVRIPSYYGGYKNIYLSVLESAMHSESLDEKNNMTIEMLQVYHFKRFLKQEL